MSTPRWTNFVKATSPTSLHQNNRPSDTKTINMKDVCQIIALSSLISLAATALAPLGYITTYKLPECSEVGGSGGEVGKIDTYIPLNECENISLFVSFQGGMGVACDKGKTPKVTAYTEPNCAGTAVDAGTILADYFDGPC